MDKKETVQTGELTYRDKLKAKYPDVVAESDEDFNGLGERYFNDSEASLKKYQDSEKAVADIIEADPDLKQVITEILVNGTPFRVAIGKFYSPEDLMPKEGEDDYDAYQKAKDERIAKAAKQAEQAKEIAENEVESSKVFEDFCNENEIADEERDAFMDIVNDALFAILYKKIDKKFLELCLKGSRFDRAVADAEKVGEINGRNANIEAKKATAEAKQTGDGIPVPQGTGGEIKQQKKVRRNPFFEGVGERHII